MNPWLPPDDDPASLRSAEADLELPDDLDMVEVDAPELAVIERVLASLDAEGDDPFVLPPPSERLPEFASTSPALAALAMQPLPLMPSADSRSALLGWLFLAGGLMALACGGVMLGWSVVESRPELWNLGLPLTVGGLAALVFGQLGLLEAASQRSRDLEASIIEHRNRLQVLQNLAVVSHSAGPSRRAA